MKKFNELVLGEATELVGVINEVKEFIGSDRLPYLTGVLSNNSGSMNIKIWQTPLSDLEVTNGQIVKLTGKLSEWTNQRKEVLKSINVEKDATNKPMVAQAKEGEYNIADIIPTAPIDLVATYEGIITMIKAFDNDTLRLLTNKIYETYKDELLIYPSAQKVHHNIKGGLLYHTSTMLRAGSALTKVYPQIKRNLFYAGIMLHDIGKVQELVVDDNGIATGYTTEGNLVGHIGIGIKIVNNAYNEVQAELLADKDNTIELDHSILVLLEHIISSHHFNELWGAYSKPAFLEAELIHHLDMIDSRVYQIEEISNDLQPGEMSENNYFLDNRRIYNPIF